MITYVPSLQDELLNSTALTPTQHKGGIGAIVGIVASIAIPFAAPAIASSIAASFALSSAVQTAISVGVGAALGAGAAAITGGNPLMGAIGGAISGGIAGYASVPTGAQSAAAGGYAPLGSGYHGVAVLAAPAAAGSAGLVAPSGFDAAAAFDDFAVGYGGAGAPTDASFIGSVGTDTVAGQAAGDVLSGGYSNTDAAYSTPSSGYTAADLNLGTGYAPGAVTRAPVTTAPVTPTGAPAATPALDTFGDKVGRFLTGEKVQQGLGKLATNVLGKAFVTEPDMSPEERMRLEQLSAARAQQERLLGQKTSVANKYLQQAATYNPEYYGQQALTDEQNRLLRAQQAGLRQISPSDTGARAAQVRRNALQKSRLGAYARGRDIAEQKRLGYTHAAAGALPSGAGLAGDYASDLAQADARYQRQKGEYGAFSDVFYPIVADTQTLTEEERRKKGPVQ